MNRDMKLIMENWRGFLVEAEEGESGGDFALAQGQREALLEQIKEKVESVKEAVEQEVIQLKRAQRKDLTDEQKEEVIEEVIKLLPSHMKENQKVIEQIKTQKPKMAALYQRILDKQRSDRSPTKHADDVVQSIIKYPVLFNSMEKLRQYGAMSILTGAGFEAYTLLSEGLQEYIKKQISIMYNQWAQALSRYTDASQKFKEESLKEVMNFFTTPDLGLQKFSDTFKQFTDPEVQKFVKIYENAPEAWWGTSVEKLQALGKLKAAEKIQMKGQEFANELQQKVQAILKTHGENLQNWLAANPDTKQFLLDIMMVKKANAELFERSGLTQLQAITDAAWGFFAAQSWSFILIAAGMFSISFFGFVKNVLSKDTNSKIILVVKSIPDLTRIIKVLIKTTTRMSLKAGKVILKMIDYVIGKTPPQLAKNKMYSAMIRENKLVMT